MPTPKRAAGDHPAADVRLPPEKPKEEPGPPDWDHLTPPADTPGGPPPMTETASNLYHPVEGPSRMPMPAGVPMPGGMAPPRPGLPIGPQPQGFAGGPIGRVPGSPGAPPPRPRLTPAYVPLVPGPRTTPPPGVELNPRQPNQPLPVHEIKTEGEEV